MPKERILITVKTYPTLSCTYGETVCTAGVREDGSWIRMYPVPFRRLDETQQYRKYDWVECDLTASTKDHRPETFHPTDVTQLIPCGHMGTHDGWRERRRLLLEKCEIYRTKTDLVKAAHDNRASLAIFKPAQILDFLHEEGPREWEPDRLAEMKQQAAQGDLFDEEQWRRTFEIIPPLPYKFSYRLEDADGEESTLRILDWEIGALYWNCLRAASGNEEIALAKVRQKYFDVFRQTDLHLYVGTTKQYHSWATNPWLIIGVLPIPHESQLTLL